MWLQRNSWEWWEFNRGHEIALTAFNWKEYVETVNDVFQRKRHKIGVLFFKQVVCHNALFFFQAISYFYICPLFGSQWAVFFISTFVWELTHALDGLIVVLFHFPFSHFGSKFMKKKPPAVVAMFSHRKTKRQAKILC
ncbi:hypothetical protein KIN20_035047 [Parelaphostrongylus tenuis]|uniref:7TM GPCR serpentine receptor class x (Srx) domain-containing protein n=1 Tax=Parelaphostrongylus tenuis TaxID=148309 RepID=A0AAD5RAM3_PARTN|nr:hypothetical protein KIN20_035047 [Parelaphostrongylus tenuis]